MTILGGLNDLCTNFPACTVAVYCDLTTGMVLGASRHLKMPQEWLDQLSLTAVELLNGDMGFAGIEHMQTAILVQGERVSLFLRAADHPSEALCCDCTADIHLVNFGRAAEQALKMMGSLP